MTIDLIKAFENFGREVERYDLHARKVSSKYKIFSGIALGLRGDDRGLRFYNIKRETVLFPFHEQSQNNGNGRGLGYILGDENILVSVAGSPADCDAAFFVAFENATSFMTREEKGKFLDSVTEEEIIKRLSACSLDGKED